MRVIAGTARSLQLKTIEGLDTRPTTDRIKETLFNVLTGYIVDSKFLDLFAGSGGIGIEALSRGASACTFVELSPKATKCIEENLKHTKLDEQATVRKCDAVSFVAGLKNVDYDVIFMDPPYQAGCEEPVLEALSKAPYVTENTLLIMEADIHKDFSFVKQYGFDIIKEKTYKTNKHVFLEKESQS